MRLITISLVTLLSLGTPAAFAGATEPTTDEQKTLYALGLAISQSLGAFSLNESELELVKSGINDGVFKKTSADLQTFGPKIQQLQQARASVVAEAETKREVHSSRKQQNQAPRKPSPALSSRPSRKGPARPPK
jgi:FKBP-type peptidyl-prolyl cis-trans isomerase FkpA/FKBP-type peptidyl-prolyl cis-trans isomerase FklB